MKFFNYLTIGLFMFSGSLAFGQKGIEDGSKYGHGEDSIRCVRGLSLSHDFVKHRDYSLALPYWKTVFDECPQASKNTYIDGVKLYKDLIEKADSDERETELLDTLMLIYDQRLKYYGEPGNVRGRQGVDLLRYGRSKIENIEKAYGYLKESVELRDAKTSDAVLASYFSSSIILFQNEKFSAGQVIEDYLLISGIVDEKLEKRSNPRLVKLKETIDQNFAEDGPGDCEKLVDYFGPMLNDKKEDVSFLKMLTGIMRDKECTDSEVFFDAAKFLFPLAPTAESALNIAILAFKNNDYQEAIDYYKQALTLETDEDKKADYYFGVAACYDGLNQKVEARDWAIKASSARDNWGEPYLLIGQLYAKSKDLCGSIRLPNSIYWAAVDQFNKAKSIDPTVAEKANSLILSYSNYFPNKETAFFENVVEGDTFVVGCWINETTKARFKN